MSCWPDDPFPRRTRFRRWRERQRNRIWRYFHRREAAERDAKEAATQKALSDALRKMGPPLTLFNPSPSIAQAYRERTTLGIPATDWYFDVIGYKPQSRLRRWIWRTQDAIWRMIEAFPMGG